LAQIGKYSAIFAVIYASASQENINSENTRRKTFPVLANFTTVVTRCNAGAAHSKTPQTLEFTASFLTHI
jgi:hypothetical protein